MSPASLDPQSVKGFLSPEEGAALEAAARACAPLGPIVEIGSYCGRSTLYLGAGARAGGGVVLAVDHHRGSPENQPGQPFHDPALWDRAAGAMDSLPALRAALRQAGLEDVVLPLVGDAATAARVWRGEAGLVFLDGGHSLAQALADWRLWGPRVALGGVLAIHDVFPDPRAGGRPPYEILQRALASGLFEDEGGPGSLRRLRRLG